MKLKIKINNVAKDVEVIEDAPGKLTVKVQGRSYACQVDGLEIALPQLASEVSPKPSVQTPSIPSENSSFGISAEHGEMLQTIIEIKSPLPGVLSSIEKKVGTRVDKGEVVLFLEAMKMLNDIVAPRSGIIESFEKSTGQTVNVGDVLFRMNVIGE